MGCSSIKDLSSLLPDLRNELIDPEKFREIYKYIFGFLKESKLVRNITAEVGLAMWNLVLPPKYPNFPKISKILAEQVEKEDIKIIKKDDWNCMLDFLEVTQGGFVGNFEDDGTWPAFIENLVALLK